MEKAINIIREYCSGKKIAVAVSGGADSMALITLVSECGFVDKNDVTVVHVNHNLRPKNAGRDAEFVRRFCAEKGLLFQLHSVDVRAECASCGLSEESAARKVRLDIFSRLINTAAVQTVLTAHHASDNAESVLMHVLRGCGISGLCGMPVYQPQTGILRPFIGTEKSVIDEYVRAKNIAFVTDETNVQNKYNRNFIRNEVLPLIRTRYPSVEKALNRLAQIASETVRQTGVAEGEITEHGAKIPYGMLSGGAVSAALRQMGCAEDIAKKHIDAVLELPECGRGARLMLPHGVTAFNGYGCVELYRMPPPDAHSDQTEPFEFGEKLILGGRLTVTDAAKSAVCKNFADDDNNPQSSKNQNSQGNNDCAQAEPMSAKTLYVDFEKIPSGAVWRQRRGGDVFRPFGGGVKKLKKFLIDKKIPRLQRDKLPCLCYNNTIYIVAGIEISEDVRVTQTTRRVAAVQFVGENNGETQS